MTVTLPAGSLSPGLADVVVTNPAPAGCLTTETVQVEIVPPPDRRQHRARADLPRRFRAGLHRQRQ
jgi:hypothetical protein